MHILTLRLFSCVIYCTNAHTDHVSQTPFFFSAILVGLYSKSIDGDMGLYVFLTFGSFLDVSSAEFINVRSQGFRIFLAVYLFNVYLITNVYKSSFVSILTYPIDPPPISMNNLVNQLVQCYVFCRFCQGTSREQPCVGGSRPLPGSGDVHGPRHEDLGDQVQV